MKQELEQIKQLADAAIYETNDKKRLQALQTISELVEQADSKARELHTCANGALTTLTEDQESGYEEKLYDSATTPLIQSLQKAIENSGYGR